MNADQTEWVLSEQRLNLGLSIKELARRCEVHEHSIRALEGRLSRPVTPATAKRVADYFGIRVSQMITAEGLTKVGDRKAAA